jgi:hypothetical protein
MIDGAEVIVLGDIVNTLEAGRAGGQEVVFQQVKTLRGDDTKTQARLEVSQARGFTREGTGTVRVLLFGSQDVFSSQKRMAKIGTSFDTEETTQLLLLPGPSVDGAVFHEDGDSATDKVIAILGNATLIEPSQTIYSHSYLYSLCWDQKSRPKITKIYLVLSESSQQLVRLRGAEGLIMLSNQKGLTTLDGMSGAFSDAQLAFALKQLAVSYREGDRTSIAILAQWLQQATSAGRRRAAAHALANIKTSNAALVLSEYFDDPDPEIRWRVIGGISGFANGLGEPGTVPLDHANRFRTAQTMSFSRFGSFQDASEEVRYIAFWKGWWARNAEEIAQLAEGLDDGVAR